VLDTKYKVPQTASTDDIAKIVAYAESQGCDDAYLVYPEQLVHPLNIQVGGKRVRASCLVLQMIWKLPAIHFCRIACHFNGRKQRGNSERP